MPRTAREPFTIRAAADDDGAALSPSGEVDAYAAPVLLEAGRAALASDHARITLDCERVWFFDSAGLRAVMLLHQEATAQGAELRITNPPELVAAVFRVAGLDHLVA